MADNPLPDELRRFILTSVPSVPYLESMLLLRREGAKQWRVAELARRLYLPENRASELLGMLVDAGVAAKTAPPMAYCYAPSPELATMLDQLDRFYFSNLLAITALIHSSVDRRAFQFADAFRWRKDS